MSDCLYDRGNAPSRHKEALPRRADVLWEDHPWLTPERALPRSLKKKRPSTNCVLRFLTIGHSSILPRHGRDFLFAALSLLLPCCNKRSIDVPSSRLNRLECKRYPNNSMISISEEIDKLTCYALLVFIFQLLLRKELFTCNKNTVHHRAFSGRKNINHSEALGIRAASAEELKWGLGLEPNSWHPVSRGVGADRPLIHDGQSSWGPYCLSLFRLSAAIIEAPPSLLMECPPSGISYGPTWVIRLYLRTVSPSTCTEATTYG